MSATRSSIVALVIGLLFLLLGVFAWGAYRKIQLDDSSSQLAIELLQHTLTTGSTERLVALAHPEWLSLMPGQAITRYIESSFRRLGALQTMSSITGEAAAPMISLPGSTVDANYSIELQMGSDPVQALVEMRYEDSQWWITNLVLNSPRLMQ